MGPSVAWYGDEALVHCPKRGREGQRVLRGQGGRYSWTAVENSSHREQDAHVPSKAEGPTGREGHGPGGRVRGYDGRGWVPTVGAVRVSS